MDRATDRDSDMERDKNNDVDKDPSEIYADGSDTQRKFVPSCMILCRSL
jgi:hypothetical protein